MSAKYSEESFKLLKLIDINNSNLNGPMLTFRWNVQSTVGELILYLKQQFSDNFDYFLKNKQGKLQSFNGKDHIKLIELLDCQQLEIQYLKQPIHQSNDQQKIQQDIQSQKLNNFQRKQLVPFNHQLQKLPKYPNNNINNKQQIESNPYQINSQNQSRSISLQEKRNLHILNSNYSQNDNYLNQSQIEQQDKQKSGYYVDKMQIKKEDPDQNLLQQLISRILQLENQVEQIKSDQTIIKQFKQDTLIIQQNQQSDLQNFDKIIRQDIQKELNLLHQSIINENKKFIKEEIEAKLSSYFNQIKMDNLDISQTDSSPKKLMKSSNKKKQEYDSSKISPRLLNTEQFLETQFFIKLSCEHQIEKSQLKQIIQNALQQGNTAKCQVCQTVLSTFNCRELGHLGDQYLTIQNTNNLNKLYQYIIDNVKNKKIIKCQNNKGCDFFCIFDQKYHTTFNTYYCPSCQINSVKE